MRGLGFIDEEDSKDDGTPVNDIEANGDDEATMGFSPNRMLGFVGNGSVNGYAKPRDRSL